ncbi:MAG: SPOR domain-containing protein [Methyloversatilis sp.]|nr:SPOR domain-containing protein [Methyloversatilis sp.]
MAKAAQKKAPARKHRGGTVVGIFIGLVLGVVLCAGVMWYINGSALPLQLREAAPTAAASGSEPVALPGKPGDKPPAKPRFDFYEILPGSQSAQPAPARTPPAAAPTPPEDSPAPAVAPAPAAAPESLVLQAGAFSSEEEADNLRARLALMGLESNVQTHAVAGKGTLYRVRLGPFASPDDMSRVRAELAQNGIDTSLVR